MDREEIKYLLRECYFPLRDHVIKCTENKTEIDIEWFYFFKNKATGAPKSTVDTFNEYYKFPNKEYMETYLFKALNRDINNYKAELNKLSTCQIDYSCENCKYFKDNETIILTDREGNNLPDGKKQYVCKTGGYRTINSLLDKNRDCDYFSPIDFIC